MNFKQTLTLGGATFLGAMVFAGQEVSAATTSIDLVDTSAIQTAIAEASTVEVQVDLSHNLVSEVTVEYTANTYPWGQCTWGAKEMAPWVMNYWGNAGDWAASAAAAGFEVGTTPKVGAIIVWTNGGYGHVGYVTEVREDGYIQIIESNYAGISTPTNVRGWFNPIASEGEVISYIYPPAEQMEGMIAHKK